MRDTLNGLKEASSLRIDLAAQQAKALAQIQKVHSELTDTVSPVVYGVSSMNNLFARRADRQRGAVLREVRAILRFRIAALMELQSLTDNVLSGPPDIENVVRDSLARLEGLLPEQDFEQLSNTGRSLFASEQPRDSQVEVMRALLRSNIEHALSELGRRVNQLDEQTAATAP